MVPNTLSIAVILGQYCDSILKKNGFKQTEEQFVDHLKKLVQLFINIIEKDIFLECYGNLLAKRLLSEKFESMELEKTMIAQIKLSCGMQITNKLEGMLNDLDKAKEETKSYEEHIQKANELKDEGDAQMSGLEFDAKILTKSYWPTYKAFKFNIPQEINSNIQQFEKYYMNKHNHRKLEWCYAMGSAIVSAKLGDKTYDLVVSTYQMCILMLFNQNESLKFS